MKTYETNIVNGDRSLSNIELMKLSFKINLIHFYKKDFLEKIIGTYWILEKTTRP